MAEFTLSGYKVAIQTALSGSEINSLASGSASVLSAEIDNSTTKYLYADMELNLASLDPVAGGYVALYLVPSVDGANWPLWDDGASPGTANNNYFVGGKYKFAVYNGAGVALASADNTLSWRPFNTASA